MKLAHYKYALLLFLLFSVLFGMAQKNRKDLYGHPNIVYIYADDLGYGDLGCYGQKKIETLHIDELAKRGMIFTQHYAFPVCAPSRNILMTGLHSGHTYIRGNDGGC